MRILSKEEVNHLFQRRLLCLKEQAYSFLIKNKFDPSPKNIFHVFRIFLLAQNYNAEDLIPYDELKRALSDEKKILAFIQKFRRDIQNYQQEIKGIVKKGVSIRVENNPVFPSFFDKSDRVYLKINTAGSEIFFVKEKIDEINFVLPVEKQLKVVLHFNDILIQTEKDQRVLNKTIGIKAGRFFKKQMFFISRLLNSRMLSSIEGRLNFLTVLKHANTYNEYVKNYSNYKKNNPFLFPRSFLTQEVFYALKKDFILIEKDDSLIDFLYRLRSFYQETFNHLHLMQTSSQSACRRDEVIDLLILSKSPTDIAGMSAYADYAKNEWGSCLSPGGINAHYLPAEIGNGVFVVFGVNSANPNKKLARISVKPYINENGAVYFGAGFMYGLMIPKVWETLNQFLSDYQPEKKGFFHLNENVYKDAVTENYYFKMNAFDIIEKHELEFKETSNNQVIVGDANKVSYQNLPKLMKIEELFFLQNYKKKFSVDLLGIEPDVSFSDMRFYLPFSCYHLNKEKAHVLPLFADELSLISPTISNFHGIKTDFNALSIHLTNHLKSLDGLSLKCRHIDLSRVKIKTPCFKMPTQVKNFIGCIVDLKADVLDMRETEGIVEWHESDLSFVREFRFSDKESEFILFATRTAPSLVLNFNGVKKVHFVPIQPVEIKDFSAPKASDLSLFNCDFLNEILDFSNCKKISCVGCSFKKVKRLILPAEAKICFKDCDFPLHLSEMDVMAKKGFGLPIDKQKTALQIKAVQKQIKHMQR